MHVVPMGELGAFGLSSFDRHARPMVLVFAAKTFILPPFGQPSDGPLAPHPEQPPPPQIDVHWGEPGQSSLRAEGQSAYTRVGTDIHVSGRAWAPGGRPLTTMQIGVRVGPCMKTAMVVGDRFWQRRTVGVRMSEPAPFQSVPVVYERSFGGATEDDICASNPVGCGLYRSAAEADGQPLPNIEAIDEQIVALSSRPSPIGFGPIPRHWQPRARWAGTYDANWIETRAPLWPDDLNLRFFSAAAPGLVAPDELRGGEPVSASGWSPDGDLHFNLPSTRMVARTTLRCGVDRRRMCLDVVDLRLDEGVLRMIWRASIPASPSEHECTWVRELERWEEPS